MNQKYSKPKTDIFVLLAEELMIPAILTGSKGDVVNGMPANPGIDSSI